MAISQRSLADPPSGAGLVADAVPVGHGLVDIRGARRRSMARLAALAAADSRRDEPRFKALIRALRLPDLS